MCTAVQYQYQDQELRLFFNHPKAKLPVKIRHTQILVPWGRRIHQPGQLPRGGSIALDVIYAGRWDQWFPKPVKLPVTAFMQTDIEDKPHWFDVPKGKWIQGLYVREKYEQRVYIVTIEPLETDSIYVSWPRILTG